MSKIYKMMGNRVEKRGGYRVGKGRRWGDERIKERGREDWIELVNGD